MSNYDYWDIATDEPLSDDDLYQRYDDLIDEVDGDVSVGTLSWAASRVLKEMDPIAYRVGFSDWLDSELGETITEDDPDDEDMSMWAVEVGDEDHTHVYRASDEDDAYLAYRENNAFYAPREDVHIYHVGDDDA